jgi:hypothetical protein
MALSAEARLALCLTNQGPLGGPLIYRRLPFPSAMSSSIWNRFFATLNLLQPACLMHVPKALSVSCVIQIADDGVVLPVRIWIEI